MGWRPNAWQVQWFEEGKRKYKRFEGDSPKQAVEFGKSLKHRGLVVEGIISCRTAFPPPLKQQTSPKIGMLWCPYCVKWREFEEAAVKKPEYTTPSLLRCTVCTISVRDAYVRMYNPELTLRYEMKMEMRERARKASKERKKASKKGEGPRGAIRIRS